MNLKLLLIDECCRALLTSAFDRHFDKLIMQHGLQAKPTCMLFMWLVVHVGCIADILWAF